MAFLCPVRMRRDKKKGKSVKSGRSSTENERLRSRTWRTEKKTSCF